jgi:replication factor C large subunit
VDGISGQSDRGGVAALEKIITTTQFPIIMTCNFRDDQKFGGLYKLASPVIELETTKVQFIHQLLRRICTEEQLDISDDQLKKLIESSGGDFRSSINDLQALAQGNKSIDDDALSSINMHRDTVTNIQEFMRKLFSAPTIRAAKDVLDDVQQEDVDYNNLHKWINENMLNYIIKISDIRYACENLALADHILGYIGRLQDYGHLPYYFDLLAGGVRFAKSDLEFIKSKVEHPRYFRLRATPDDEVSLKLQHLFRVSLNDVVKQLGPTLDQFKDSDGLIRQYLNEKTNIVEKEAKGVKEDKDSDDE